MKTMKFLSTGLILVAIAMTSCSKDSVEGPIGPQGQQGIQGPAGQDGEAQGVPGPAGANGTNGEDGNANVRVFKYDISEISGGTYTQGIPEITTEVLENDLILGYISTNIRENSPIPTSNARIGGRSDIDVAVNIEIAKYQFSFFKSGEFILMAPGSMEKLKIIIAKSTSLSGKTSKESLQLELKSAGVDTNDYYAVMDYFRLEY